MISSSHTTIHHFTSYCINVCDYTITRIKEDEIESYDKIESCEKKNTTNGIEM